MEARPPSLYSLERLLMLKLVHHREQLYFLGWVL